MQSPKRSPGSRLRLVRSASLMGSFTVASRVLGYVRDSLNAALFGAGAVADAFFVAFRIPNLLRDLVAEGAMSASFIPVLGRLIERKGPREANRLASSLTTLVALGGIAVVAAGVLAAPFLVSALAPGFRASPEKFELTVSLTRWLMPFIALVSLASVVMGLLNSRERFGAPAAAPVAFNACIILCALVLVPLAGGSPSAQIRVWTAGVLAGGLVQWLVQIPAARGLGFRFTWRPWHPATREVGKLMAPALVGLSIGQVHLLVNTILASLLPEGSVAYLYYGNRLMQLPLGVFGVALSTAAFPVVARAFGAGRPAAAAGPLNHSVSLAAFTVLPASAGLAALAPEINGLLFRFGRFSAADVQMTAAVSIAYAAGILGHAVTRVLTPAFYAAGAPSVPVRIAVAGVAANALLSVVLMPVLGVVGLPLSTSTVALVTCVWLGVRLGKYVPGLGGREVGMALLKSVLAAAVMGAVVFAAARAGGAWMAAAGWAPKLRDATLVAGGIALGVAVYAGLARALGMRELGDVTAAFRRRRG